MRVSEFTERERGKRDSNPLLFVFKTNALPDELFRCVLARWERTRAKMILRPSVQAAIV